MTIKRAIFDKVSDTLITLLGLNHPTRWSRAFLSRIHCVKRVTVNGMSINFDANDELHLLRAQWLNTKEPETLAWIDTFDHGDLFYDIGANVGVFSLYAALHRDCQVYAFEPEAKNYACLNKNILLNSLGRRVKALNVALHDQTTIEFLNLHDLTSGSALHSVGEPIDSRGQRFEPKFEQAVLAFSLDDFIRVFSAPVPQHVKIDVDGNELKIIEGALKTLSDHRCRSVQIEINQDDHALRGRMKECGFSLATETRVAMQRNNTSLVNAVFRKH